jgi:hypothetical protein
MFVTIHPQTSSCHVLPLFSLLNTPVELPAYSVCLSIAASKLTAPGIDDARRIHLVPSSEE